MEERLQKYMARCGVASRRKCEELIARGQVEVNGETVREAGVKIDPLRDRVKVDGRVLHAEKPAYYIHYKVKGVTTTVADDLGRRTVMDCLPALAERVFPVGRLDRESEGLLVLTNDGALADYLTHPAYGIEKTYRVVAEGRVPEETLSELALKGIRLGPVLVKPSRVELVRYDNLNTVALISVAEGVNREVRRIFAALGHEVKKLLRIQVGPLTLKGMKRGLTRQLTPKEVSQLKKAMDGEEVETIDPAALFPPGSAANRRPAGPRGRLRKTKAPRQGKPDPAANRQFAAGKKKKAFAPQEKPGRRGGRPVAAALAQAVGRRGKPFAAAKPARSAKPGKPALKSGQSAAVRKNKTPQHPLSLPHASPASRPGLRNKRQGGRHG